MNEERNGKKIRAVRKRMEGRDKEIRKVIGIFMRGQERMQGGLEGGGEE